MRSENKIDASSFDEIKLNLTPDEKDKLRRNWNGKLVDGKLILEISAQEKTEKDKKDKEDLVTKTKEDLKNAKSLDDIKQILENFLT